MKYVISIFLVLLLAPFANAKLSLVKEVDRGVWRGSQPTSNRDFDELEAKNIKMIINIQRPNDKHVEPERKMAEERGIRFVHLPLVATQRPTDEQIREIFKYLLNPAHHPVYLHCTLGRDRTGLIFALYRVRVQGVSPEKAYEEWTSMGFNGRALKGLDGYFKDVTDFRDSSGQKKRRRALACVEALAQ